MSNGGFENGNLSGWDQTSDGACGWEAYSGSNLGGFKLDKPPQGAYATVALEESPCHVALFQSLSLGSKPQQVSFYAYYRNDLGTSFEPFFQEYRIDLLRDGADSADRGSGRRPEDSFFTKNGDPAHLAATKLTFSLATLSGRVTLRLIVTVCCAELNGMVDDVQLKNIG